MLFDNTGVTLFQCSLSKLMYGKFRYQPNVIYHQFLEHVRSVDGQFAITVDYQMQK